MNAKNTAAAPRATPDAPKRPNDPAFGGTNGCQLRELIYEKPNAITATSTASLIATSTALTFAVKRMPRAVIAVSAAMSSTAGRLIPPPAIRLTLEPYSAANALCASAGGIVQPS